MQRPFNIGKVGDASFTASLVKRDAWHASKISKMLNPDEFGVLLIISGLFQFSRLKTKCLGYCESPISFFMRRWSSRTVGAVKMGTYHGLYCLRCCWPYFLLMVALGG
jgi:predicted metal-binding membrane protein